MNRFLISSVSIILWAALIACKEDDATDSLASPVELTFTFESGPEGWEAGFADYPVGEDDFYELGAEVSSLPPPLDEAQKGFKLTGNNHSDDLFMFITRRVSDLEPSTTYQLAVEVELASNAPQSSFGIGGSPGSSVYLKAGAADQEPQAVRDGDFWQLNLDKGNQSQAGTDMQVLGTIGTNREDFTYALVSLDNRTEPFTIQTNDQGELWVIIGTDSGFEGTTTLYYNQIELRLLP